jgi:hypothetical protein
MFKQRSALFYFKDPRILVNIFYFLKNFTKIWQLRFFGREMVKCVLVEASLHDLLTAGTQMFY